MRRRCKPLLLVATLMAGLVGIGAEAEEGPAVAMRQAAESFLDSLSAEQRERALYTFDDAERLNWHFVPRDRRGLPLKEMTAEQQAFARELLEAGLGARGALKAQTIIELELVLREMGQNPRFRDPELYFFTIFGKPSDDEAWGWRAEGHHLALNFTVADGSLVATAPAFFGANPATVRTGSRQGLRALAGEEDLARALVTSLDDEQLAVTLIDTEAPADIVTGNSVRVGPLEPVGIPIARFTPAQASLFEQLMEEYFARVAAELAAERRQRFEQTDLDQVRFAWAGSLRPGQGHYYRIQGPSFLIEYDNTQNDANHVHTVWRDFEGDFGRDLLREHYQNVSHRH